MDSSPRSSCSATSIQSLQESVQYLAGRLQHQQARIEVLEDQERQLSTRVRVLEYLLRGLRRLFRTFSEDSGPTELEP